MLKNVEVIFPKFVRSDCFNVFLIEEITGKLMGEKFNNITTNIWNLSECLFY